MAKKIFFLFIAGIMAVSAAFTQTDSCQTRISLLTCSPGTELYSLFGHSALRVTSEGSDIIFNYGTFDFEDPDFYKKFVGGKLLYFVSVEQFAHFLYAYQYERRGVIEQELNLSCAEKVKLSAALHENAREENKYYKYDFLFDNCSSRLRDITEANHTDSLSYRNILPAPNKSFRNLIHEYLNKGNQPWSKLGIDILLGSRIDRRAANREAMFLPDYLMKGFDSASAAGTPLVKSKHVLNPATTVAGQTGLITPFLVFFVLFMFVGALGFAKSSFAVKTLAVIDFLLFFLTGALGILLLFMWFGTDHIFCSDNFNLLWALPTNLVVAAFLFSQKKWMKPWLYTTAAIAGLLLISWKLLPQQMNIAILPLVALIMFRSVFHARKITR